MHSEHIEHTRLYIPLDFLRLVTSVTTTMTNTTPPIKHPQITAIFQTANSSAGGGRGFSSE